VYTGSVYSSEKEADADIGLFKFYHTYPQPPELPPKPEFFDWSTNTPRETLSWQAVIDAGVTVFNTYDQNVRRKPSVGLDVSCGGVYNHWPNKYEKQRPFVLWTTKSLYSDYVVGVGLNMCDANQRLMTPDLVLLIESSIIKLWNSYISSESISWGINSTQSM
jgi:hypothetical protein